MIMARREAALASPYRHIDDLIREADVRELVSQLTPHRETRLKNELHANELQANEIRDHIRRSRIALQN